MAIRKLTRDALPNKHPFGLKTKGSGRVNLESAISPSVDLQHLGAVCLLGGQRAGMNTLRKLVAQINLEGREPTDIEKKFLVDRCKAIFTVPGLTYNDLVRPVGTWNMEAEGEEELPEEPTEPEEPAAEDEAAPKGEGDTEASDESDEDEPAEPEEPGEEPTDEGEGESEESPASTSEADINAPEEQPAPVEPEHKVNVVMRAGEVEINIEDAMDKYQTLADGIVQEIGQYTQAEYVRLKEAFIGLCVDIDRYRSINAKSTSLSVSLSLVANDICRLGFDFPTMKSRLVELAHCYTRLSSDLYQHDIPTALAKYEEGHAADGADIIKGSLLALANLQDLSSVYEHRPIAPEDGIEIAMVVPRSISEDMTAVTLSITPHQLTQLNNIACDLLCRLKGSDFLKTFADLSDRAKAITAPQEESGAPQDPYVYVQHFDTIFHMQNVYVLQGMVAALEQLKHINQCVSETPIA